MRIDYNRLIAEVRLDCQDPDPQKPTDDVIMMNAGDVAQAMMNRLANSPPGWSQRYFDLQVGPGDGIFRITEMDFSKPVRIHTIDPSDPNHVTRKIDDCDMQNVDEFYRGPTKAYSARKHSAEIMVFRKEGGETFVHVIPEPSEAAIYRIWFNTGAINDPRKGDSAPIPPEFFRYLRSQVSSIVLGHCRWGGVMNADIMAAAEDSIEKKLTLSKPEWDRFVLTNSVTGSTSPRGYADWYMNDWF